MFSVKTLYNFTYQIDVIDYDSYYEVTINVTDPNHNFQIAYYYLYEVQDEFDMYVSSGEYGFTPIDNYKTVTFTIDKQGNIPFRIDIGLRNETVSTYTSIIKTITVLE